MKSIRMIVILSILGMLLLIPLIAMQFIDEVEWGIVDFIVIGILLSGTWFLCDFALRKFKNTFSRIAICGLILFIFFLIWAELAVGIFGSPFTGS